MAERPWVALRLFDEAVDTARANGLVQVEALACERAAALYRQLGVPGSAARWLRALWSG